jgi:putative membrane protein insertion efficiency factor
LWPFVIFSLLYVSVVEVESCYRCLLLKKPVIRTSICSFHRLAPLDLQPQRHRLRSGRGGLVVADVSTFMVVGGEEGEKEEKIGNADADDDAVTTGNRDLKDGLKDVMISWIKWYRNTLSPIMPPNCRFFPSCSVYAIDAIEKFGSVKGGVLTGWRILRCNPLGGAGYDPPQWPPPGFRAGTNTKRW